MTYFGFLARFLGIPILVLSVLLLIDHRRGRGMPESLRLVPAWLAVLVHVILAVVWTTPWDNYLVATGVWWYDPQLVTGLTIGWVPIEEYTFFVVQTVMTGFWLIWLTHRLREPGPMQPRPMLRWASAIAVGFLWVLSIAVLLSNWEAGTYLGLELGWLLPPIILQLAVGADLLWHHRRLVALALIPPIVYLSAADAVAIGSGTWSIDPAQTTGILLGGRLPFEELLFFGLTNTLIVFGMVLLLGFERESLKRFLRRPIAASTADVSDSHIAHKGRPA